MSPPVSPARDQRESELLAAVAHGDRRAFDELYLAYHRRLTRFVLRVARRYEIAEEVINDTFWIVWQKAEEFRNASRVSTWIMGIAYRQILKALRNTRSGLPSVGNASPAAQSGIEGPARNTEERDWIMHGLQQLPPAQRMAIELAYYLGHSCEEIAEIMGCSVPMVKTRMFHAREKLRISLPRLAGAAGQGNSRQVHS